MDESSCIKHSVLMAEWVQQKTEGPAGKGVLQSLCSIFHTNQYIDVASTGSCLLGYG